MRSPDGILSGVRGRLSVLLASFVPAPVLLATTCNADSGAPRCGNGVNYSRSQAGPVALPDGPVTWGDLQAHPEASLLTPSAEHVTEFGDQECIDYPDLGRTVEAATAGHEFATPVSYVALKSFYGSWLAAHGWKLTFELTSPNPNESYVWSRGTRERFQLNLTEGPTPAPTGEVGWTTAYSIQPYCKQLQGDQHC